MLTDNLNRPQLKSNFAELDFQTPVSKHSFIVIGFKWNSAGYTFLWLVLLVDRSYYNWSIANFKTVWTRIPIWLVCNWGPCSHRIFIHYICKNKVWIQRQQNRKSVCPDSNDCVRSILHLHQCLLSCLVNLHNVHRASPSLSSSRIYNRRNCDCWHFSDTVQQFKQSKVVVI